MAQKMKRAKLLSEIHRLLKEKKNRRLLKAEKNLDIGVKS